MSSPTACRAILKEQRQFGEVAAPLRDSFVMNGDPSRRSAARGNNLRKPTGHYGCGSALRVEFVGAERALSLVVLNATSSHLAIEFSNIEIDGVSFTVGVETAPQVRGYPCWPQVDAIAFVFGSAENTQLKVHGVFLFRHFDTFDI